MFDLGVAVRATSGAQELLQRLETGVYASIRSRFDAVRDRIGVPKPRSCRPGRVDGSYFDLKKG
jgi:hypothetical protein